MQAGQVCGSGKVVGGISPLNNAKIPTPLQGRADNSYLEVLESIHGGVCNKPEPCCRVSFALEYG